MLEISAPGKLILCGEHAVVYGKKALACAIDLRTHLKSNKQENPLDIFEIKLANLNQTLTINKSLYDSYMAEVNSEQNNNSLIENLQQNQNHSNTIKSLIFMFKSLEHTLNWSQLSGQQVEITSKIPLAAGLGSSAAYSVCMSAYFLLLSSQITNDLTDSTNLKRINEHAFFLEKIFHGQPSGIDNSVSTYGNYVLFENGRVSQNLKSTLYLSVLIVNSGIPKETKQQVANVRNIYNKHASIMDHLLNSVDSLVEKFVNILSQDETDNENCMVDLNDLITMNQGVLYAFQVSHTSLNEIANVAQRYNMHCKITGSGGGGCCYILVNKSLQVSSLTEFIGCLNGKNFVSFFTKLGCEGVKFEHL